MKLIPLSQGFEALVDDEDFDSVNEFKWHAAVDDERVYAVRNVYLSGRRTLQYLHHFVLGVEGKQVDHRNGDGRDNQKNNLRPANDQQNSRGFRRKIDRPFCPFRGVSWSKGLWRARLSIGGKKIELGKFSLSEDAARARDGMARQLGWPEEGMNFPL